MQEYLFLRVARINMVSLKFSTRSGMSLAHLCFFEILSLHSDELYAEADSKMRSKMESMDGRKKREFIVFVTGHMKFVFLA